MAFPTKEAQPAWFKWALAYPMTSGFVKSSNSRKDVNINYLQWKPPLAKCPVVEKGTLPASIVLLHGTAAHAHWYHHIGPFLAEDGYEVVAVSFSGHGDSDTDPDMSPEMSGYSLWSKEVIDVCNTLELFDSRRSSKPIIVGHSLGSYVAEQVCLEAGPSRIGGLVALDGGVPHPFYWHWKKLEADSPSLDFNVAPPRERRIYSTSEHLPVDRLRLAPQQEGVLPFVLEHIANKGARMLENQPGKWVWKVDPDYNSKGGFKHFVLKIGIPEVLKSMEHRVAFVFGEKSAIVTKTTRQYMRYTLGDNLSVIGIPYAGHHCFLDQPLAVISVFRTLFSEWNRSSTLTGTGKLLPRLGPRASLSTNEDGGYDGREDLMLERTMEEFKRLVKPNDNSSL